MGKILKNKGITLVALVITIIILLILAGITISQLTGSGLFENAKLAQEKSKNAQQKEDETLSDYENKLEGYINNNRETITVDKERFEALEQKVTTLTEQLNTIKQADGMENIKQYYAGNTNKFKDIELETGDYLCLISTYGMGTINEKPSQYIISYGNNSGEYNAKYYQMIAGNTTFTINVTPRTETNEKGILSISGPRTAHYHCILIKLDNGHT